MKYQAIVSDLDGTLLNGEHRFSNKTKKVIKEVKDRVKKIFIATGRHHLDALELKKQLGLDSYLISSNGAIIHNENNEIVYERDIEEDIVKKILEKKCSKDVSRHIYTVSNWYIEEELEEFKSFHQESGFSYTIEDFDKFDCSRVIKIFFISKNFKELEDLEKKIENEFRDRISLTLSGEECLEIMAHSVCKGEAIKSVMARLGIPLESVIAFGDGLNDYEMLKEVGKGLIMENASVRLKDRLPNNEIVGKNTEDGVAEYLERNFLEIE